MKKQIMKKQSLKKQKGMTMISWAVVLVFIGFHFMMAIKIIPLFAEDHTITGAWAKLGNEASLVGATPQKIRALIVKRLRLNNVYSLENDDIKIKRGSGYYIVTVEYEPRGTILGKLDYIVSFKHVAKIKATAN
ncbi:MAG: DUF4845 domain-containing protein [Gammaproteobacteria bacterium]|nr:DUF4845 domain-containing protein [Gammaproteobacteria bacterium]